MRLSRQGEKVKRPKKQTKDDGREKRGSGLRRLCPSAAATEGGKAMAKESRNQFVVSLLSLGKYYAS